MELKKSHTNRGFKKIEFSDRYGQQCSLQKSSLAFEDAVWFGIDNTGPYLDGPNGNRSEEIFGRMHLTQDEVRELLPLLTHFAETGELP